MLLAFVNTIIMINNVDERQRKTEKNIYVSRIFSQNHSFFDKVFKTNKKKNRKNTHFSVESKELHYYIVRSGKNGQRDCN